MEAELGSLFINYQLGESMHVSLTEMGHKPPSTLEVKDIATGNGFVNFRIQKYTPHAINMIFYWVQHIV